MSNNFVLNATAREPGNRGAVKRLRREGQVPGVIYGGHADVTAIAVPQNELSRNLEFEAFYSQIITVQVGSKKEEVVLKALQRHPAKPKILHLDMQRIVAGEAITVQVPLHFKGEEECPGVKEEGGVVEHHRTDVEISALPKNLPEYIEVDVSALKVDDALHLSEITFPEGVESTDLAHEHDFTLISVHQPRIEVEPAEEEEAAEGEEASAEAAEGEEEADSDGEEEE